MDGDSDRTNQKQKQLPKDQQVQPDTNDGDMRFIVPTEQPQLAASQNSQPTKPKADNSNNLETNFANASDAQQAANEEHELETRLK